MPLLRAKAEPDECVCDGPGDRGRWGLAAGAPATVRFLGCAQDAASAGACSGSSPGQDRSEARAAQRVLAGDARPHVAVLEERRRPESPLPASGPPAALLRGGSRFHVTGTPRLRSHGDGSVTLQKRKPNS